MMGLMLLRHIDISTSPQTNGVVPLAPGSTGPGIRGSRGPRVPGSTGPGIRGSLGPPDPSDTFYNI